MTSDSLYDAVEPFPERFNLCAYYLDRNVEEGRAKRTALLSGDRRRTYGEVGERAARAAGLLRRAGVRPEERVLIVLPDGFAFAEAFFATLRAGAVFAMVSPLLKRADFAYYLEYTKARTVFVHESVIAELEPAAREGRFCQVLFVVRDEENPAATGSTDEPTLPLRPASGAPGSLAVLDYDAALATVDPHSPDTALEPTSPDDLAGWLFTSGSTGKPKACVHTHADFAWNTETYALQVVRYEADDVCLSVPKLFFGYATGTNLMFPFRVGARSILFPGRSTADELFDQIAAHRPTLLTSVPTMINNMLRSPRFDETDFSSLRVCLSAGEALPPKLYEEWKERTGVEILDGIGSAEMFHIYISNYPGDVKLKSLGRIVPGYEASIVRPDGTEVPPGEPGRLRIRGGSTALCYWADRVKSRETFQGEWCTSADIFRRDEDGYYYYEGRADDLIKVSGIWTSPLEIENTLLGHDAVDEVCVVGHQDDDELTKPLAFVVLAEGREGTDALAADLKAWVKDRLAPHKYPRWFEWRDALPKNDRGKVARKVLKEELAARAAEPFEGGADR